MGKMSGFDFIEIGSAPSEEDCVQVGDPDYSNRAREECKLFIRAIRKHLGPEPDGARLGIKWFDHDMGQRAEVVCYFDPEKPDAVQYAFDCEEKGPTTWAEAGMQAPRWGRGR